MLSNPGMCSNTYECQDFSRELDPISTISCRLGSCAISPVYTSTSTFLPSLPSIEIIQPTNGTNYPTAADVLVTGCRL